MQYRMFGNTGRKLSVLGFGAMRLPIIDNDQAKIDETAATRMIRTAIDNGVNYVDTAWPYHREQSERFVGRVLADGYRKKVNLATKLPAWLIEKPEDFDFYLNEQLKRLNTDKIDFYLLHALNKKSWAKIRDLGVLQWCEEKKKEGKIDFIGFSFHDELPIFIDIVDSYDKWDFCQIQYNYMDIYHQAGIKGLKYAHEKGLGIIIMEPLRGGQLAKEPPISVNKIWKNFSQPLTPAQAALHWLWNQPEVGVVLSGMNTMSQVEENIAAASQSRIRYFKNNDLTIFEKIREEYMDLRPVACTGCGYCIPCPQNVDIPRTFWIYNMAKMYDDLPTAQSFYKMMKEETKAPHCIECGVCETKCPQNISIIDELKIAHKLLFKD